MTRERKFHKKFCTQCVVLLSNKLPLICKQNCPWESLFLLVRKDKIYDLFLGIIIDKIQFIIFHYKIFLKFYKAFRTLSSHNHRSDQIHLIKRRYFLLTVNRSKAMHERRAESLETKKSWSKKTKQKQPYWTHIPPIKFFFFT